MTIVLGILGPAGSGKSTAAKYLVEKYGARRYAFATPLKEILKYAFEFSDEQLFGTQEQKEDVDPRYNHSARWFMQRLGTEGIRRVFGDRFWARECLRKITLDADAESLADMGHPGPYLAVIDDVRFISEADEVRWYDARKYNDDPDNGGFVGARGYVWRLETNWAESSADPTHQSEAEWLKAPFDESIRPTAYGVEHLYAELDRACAKYGISPLATFSTEHDPKRSPGRHYQEMEPQSLPKPGQGQCRHCGHFPLIHGASQCHHLDVWDGEVPPAEAYCTCPGYEPQPTGTL